MVVGTARGQDDWQDRRKPDPGVSCLSFSGPSPEPWQREDKEAGGQILVASNPRAFTLGGLHLQSSRDSSEKGLLLCRTCIHIYTEISDEHFV